MVRLIVSPEGQPRVARATLALMASICGLHFTALLGDTITVDGRALPAGFAGLFGGDSRQLAFLVAATSGVLLLGAFAAALVDRKISLMSQNQADALNYYANHDELTRLANRRQLRDRLARLLAAPDHNFMVLYLDLDRFKSINSLFGHATGDRLLKRAATRLQSLLGPHDMAGRLGGDEFLLLQPLPPGAAPDTRLAERVVRALAEPFLLEEGTLRIGVSLGIEQCVAGDGAEAEILLTHADIALSHAKQQGGGRFCIYHEKMDEQLAARRQLERDLGQALARGEMFLHYQPLCSATGVARGFEALLRWRHHERGMISPAEFIPFAERSGHIRAIGLFVIEEACRIAMTWPEHLRIAVNISAVQLSDDDLFDSIKDILQRTGLPPHRLELEITESTLIEDAAHVGALLRKVHEFGIELAIDDFGTGYSNLSHLRDFCAGTLKLDRSFISGLRGNTDAASIVGALTGLGHALGMKVLAEGVETEQELRLIRAMGCDEVQGYYLARPMPGADVTTWLARAEAAPAPAVVSELTA
jgi:diguanylate cyclase (GGDEF)-like protein